MSVDIRVALGETLSRRACAVVVKHIIKYIAYNNHQIPYAYDGLQRLVAKRRRLVDEGNTEVRSKLPLSFKQIKANRFYEKIEGIYDAFETTFKCIEEELIRGTTFTEIVVVLGATLVSPKHVYRIRIPELSSQEECDSKIRSHLFKIYRSIISHGCTQLSGKCSGPTNTFILVHGDCDASATSWFIPKFDFRIPSTASQTLIAFDDLPEGTVPSCKSTVPPANCWFLAKQALNGFQDMKIDGKSVYNILYGFDR